MIIKRLVWSISLLTFGIACSNQQSKNLPEHIQGLENLTVYSVDSELPYQMRIEREQEFGDTDDAYINTMTDVTVDNEGRVYIADGEELDIKIYEPDGQLLTQLGRRGQGPGEFMEISNVQIENNKLVVFDRQKQQSAVFFVDSLAYSHTVPIADNRREIDELREAYLNRHYLRSDNTFLMLFLVSNSVEEIRDWDEFENRTLYFLLDESGDVVSDKLFDSTSSFQVMVPFGGGRSVGVPVKFYGTLLTALTNDDHIYLAWSEDFLIKRYSPEGEYEDAFYYPFLRVPLLPEATFPEAGPELIREATQSMDLPETSPALNEMFFDDQNRLWISTIVEDLGIYEWWVLEETGELITKFEWPRNEPIEVVKNGYMYTRETDAETGLQQAVRYRVAME